MRNENWTFYCAAPGCNVEVNGIYCFEHREQKEAERRALAEERSNRLKALWENNREGMLAAIRAGKAGA